MKVSVIVPVYNVQAYIRESVLSILNQTMCDFEVIIVNDGSTDQSIEIISDLIDEYDNITLINQENKGLSNARNTGLKVANGEYISFVDSDDFIGENFLATLYKEAKKYDLDIACGSYIRFYENKKFFQDSREDELYTKTEITGVEFLYCQLKKNNYRMEVWDDLYKRSFLEKNSLIFYDGLMHEDELFTPLALLAARRVKLVKDYNYFYRQRSTGIMGSGSKQKSIKDLIKIINLLNDEFLIEKNTFKKKALSKSINHLVIITAFRIAIYKKKKYFYKLLNVRDIKTTIWFDSNLALKVKFKFFFLEKMPSLYAFIINFKYKIPIER